MIRVLHVVTYMGRGGLETMLMNYYRNIDRSKIQFDFLVHRDFIADYDEEILSLGGRIYRLPQLNPISKSYLKSINLFFEKHKEYNIVHSHLDCMSAIPLYFAKKHRIPVRVAHSHSSSQTKDKKYVLKLMFKELIPRYATHLFACTEAAGEWMFSGKKFYVINNAIDATKYIYSSQLAKTKMYELGIKKNSLIIGHVGRFDVPKNHKFIIEIFSKILQKEPDARLILVGDGVLRSQIEEQIHKLKLEGNVILTGLRTDVNEILQIMDVFLFPSLYEGLPLSIVEAQAAGLPCLISDKVPIACKITDLVYQMQLTDSCDNWANKILELSRIPKQNTYNQISISGFDIKENARKLQNFYLNQNKKYQK